MYTKKRKRQIFIVILCLAVVGGSYGIYAYVTQDPYKTYTAYKEENKNAGTMKHDIQDEETFYLSVYYLSLIHISLAELNEFLNKMERFFHSVP